MHLILDVLGLSIFCSDNEVEDIVEDLEKMCSISDDDDKFGIDFYDEIEDDEE